VILRNNVLAVLLYLRLDSVLGWALLIFSQTILLPHLWFNSVWNLDLPTDILDELDTICRPTEVYCDHVHIYLGLSHPRTLKICSEFNYKRESLLYLVL
jgi:hypothetical protein